MRGVNGSTMPFSTLLSLKLLALAPCRKLCPPFFRTPSDTHTLMFNMLLCCCDSAWLSSQHLAIHAHECQTCCLTTRSQHGYLQEAWSNTRANIRYAETPQRCMTKASITWAHTKFNAALLAMIYMQAAPCQGVHHSQLKCGEHSFDTQCKTSQCRGAKHNIRLTC